MASFPQEVNHAMMPRNPMKFKKGGRVKKTGKAILHKGEFVLPVGVKPTKAQMKKVAKKRK